MFELPVLPAAIEMLLQVGLVLVVVVVAIALLRQAIRVAVRGILERRAAEGDGSVIPPLELERRVNTIARLVLRVGGASIAVIGVLMILGIFDIDVGPAVAGLGVVGIAVGFGAQTLIRDWLAGIFVVLENQYNEGDVVRIAGVDGVVESLSLRRTTLRDLDGTVHTVPNGQITVASNMTRLWARMAIDVAAAPGTDVERASKIIRDVGAEFAAEAEWSSRILEPPRVARADEAESELRLQVIGQVRVADRRTAAAELRTQILAAFAREGISSPTAHQADADDAEQAGGDRSGQVDPTAPVGHGR